MAASTGWRCCRTGRWSSAAPPPAAGSRRRLDPRPQRRVVFFCDGDLDGGSLGDQLSCFGYTFTSFTDPEELKQAVLELPPDAVVMSTNGAELFADLHARVAVPLLFVSDRADFATRLKAVKAGGEAYFSSRSRPTRWWTPFDTVTVRREPDPFRVLIVDDEPEMADYHALILEGSRHDRGGSTSPPGCWTNWASSNRTWC